MNLAEEEYREFLSVHLKFLFYVGRHQKLVAEKVDFQEFINLDFKVKFKCRQQSYKIKNLLEQYITDEQNNMSDQEYKIITGFRKRITSDFIIYKCLNNEAIFIDTSNNKFYAVKALSNPFTDFSDHFPFLVKTTILPYRDKIIYDGFLEPYNMVFGPGLRSTMKNEYNEAKKQNKIIRILE